MEKILQNDSDIQPDTSKPASGCTGECKGCASDHQLPTETQPGGLEGWRLATTAIGAFLVPLIFAVIGALLVGTTTTGPDATLQKMLGGLGGLFIGILFAIVFGRFVGRTQKEKA